WVAFSTGYQLSCASFARHCWQRPATTVALPLRPPLLMSPCLDPPRLHPQARPARPRFVGVRYCAHFLGQATKVVVAGLASPVAPPPSRAACFLAVRALSGGM